MFQMRKKPEPSIEVEPKLDRLEDDQAGMPVLYDQPQGDATMNAGASLLDAQDLQPATATSNSAQGALLGKGARFEGKLTFEGTVEIQGEFYGEISSNGHLVVSKDARIEGTVEVASAHISGHLKGNIKTSGTLELCSSAHVSGEIEVNSLTVEKGAFFQGQVTMTNS
jgi:cytoskeletal protein CcmA (bactofilin family)